MSDHEREKGSTDPSGMKRTSKQQKKLADPGAVDADQGLVDFVVPFPPAPCEARVSGVNAEYLAHGRDVA